MLWLKFVKSFFNLKFVKTFNFYMNIYIFKLH